MSEHTKLVSQSWFYHIRALLDLSTATAIASALISSRLDYANSVLYGSPSKNIAHLQSSKSCSKSCYTKTITLVFGRYTLWTPLTLSSMVYQVQACLSYLQGDAHWYFTLPLMSSYCPFCVFRSSPPLTSPNHFSWVLHIKPYFRFPLFPHSCSNYLELSSWLTPFIWYIPLFQMAPQNTSLPHSF